MRSRGPRTRRATELLREALSALERLPDTRDTLAQAIDARLELRVALVPLGRYHDALAVMREAEGLATRLGDRARLGRVLADICARLRNVTGEHLQAIEVGQRALAIAAEDGDRALELEAQYRTGQAYFAIGDYAQALDLLSRCAAGADEGRRELSPLFASWAHTWLALTLSSLGRFAEARSHAEEGLRIAEGADHPFTLAEALTGLGSVFLAQGNVNPAIEALERARVIARKWSLQPWALVARLGHAFALAGRPVEARDLLEEVARSATTMSSMGVGRAMQLAWLGEAHLREGRLDAARERRPGGQFSRGAVPGARSRGVESSLARRDRLAWRLRRIVTKRRRTTARPWRWPASLACVRSSPTAISISASSSGEAGHADHAREHLVNAARLYREMDMDV